MRTILIAELAVNHLGDLALAKDMIGAAADAGCDYAKTQAYDIAKMRPTDANYDVYRQAQLYAQDHEALMAHCQQRGIRYLSTPFDADSLDMLRRLGLKQFKVASSESSNNWWRWDEGRAIPGETWFVSWAWGRQGTISGTYNLTAIPLYPTPLECVGQATLLDGWSCHAVGNEACLWAIANGAKVIEAHLYLEGRGRQMPWDRTPAQLARLREFADNCATMTSGVATRFRTRWTGEQARAV